MVQWADCTKEGCDYRSCWPCKQDTDDLVLNNLGSDCGLGSVNNEDMINNLPVINLVSSMPSWSGEPKFENPRGNINIDTSSQRSTNAKGNSPQSQLAKYEKFMAKRLLESKDTMDLALESNSKLESKVEKTNLKTAMNKTDKFIKANKPKNKSVPLSQNKSNIGSGLSSNVSFGSVNKSKPKTNSSPTDLKYVQSKTRNSKILMSKHKQDMKINYEGTTLRTHSERKPNKSLGPVKSSFSVKSTTQTFAKSKI